jgi:hypothetical protein
MEKYVHLILSGWILSHLGHAVLSMPVLVFDIICIVAALLYLVFFFPSQRERYRGSFRHHGEDH